MSVEFCEPRLASVVEDQNGVDHGGCSLCSFVVREDLKMVGTRAEMKLFRFRDGVVDGLGSRG